MHPGASGSRSLPQQIVEDLEREIEQWRKQTPHPLSNCHSSIYLFPDDVLSGIEEGIRLPKLAYFGPYYRAKAGLLPFQKHKKNLGFKFLDRLGKSSRSSLVSKLWSQERNIRGCYHEPTDSISWTDFVNMMLLDGCFIVELFLQHQEGLDTTWPFYSDLNTLIADLLKIGNQLPFSVLEDLYRPFCKTGNQATSSSVDLKTLALTFFNDALGRPSDMSYRYGQRQPPKHLLDLFRSSLLLPSTPQKSSFKAFPNSIQRAELLSNAGISLRRKTRAKTLLAIDFRKLQIPPFALKIPPISIDDHDPTSTILINCVALEQCSIHAPKHFTAYILFMNCLMRQPEDVEFLRAANIITGIKRDDHQFVLNLLQSVRENAYLNGKDSYLWKQYKEIDSCCNSFGAKMWCNVARHTSLTVIVAFIAAIIALCNWLFTWLLPKDSSKGS